MASPAVLAIRIVADATGATKAMDQASARSQKFAKAGALAAAGFAVVAGALFDAAKAAADDAKGQALLATSLKKSAGASDAAIASTEDWITAQGKALGVADDQLRPALATLARATGDVEESQKAAALAMDISAATGKDLGSVSAALAKGYGGNTASLGKLVPGLDKATLATKDMKKISAELARITGGSAAAAADTAAGKFDRMKLAVNEAKEGVGAALLPALTALAGILMTVAQWAQDNSTVFLVLLGVLGGMAAVVMAVSAAMRVQAAVTAIVTAAQWLWNAALTANPIGLIIVGIVALIAAIVLLWKNSETFRNVVTTAFQAVANAVKVVVSWLADKLAAAWRIVQAVASAVITAVATYFRIWFTIFSTVATVIQTVLVKAFSVLKAVALPIISVITGAFSLLLKGIQAVIDAVKWVIDLIKNIHLPSLPSWIPGVGGNAAPAVAGVGAMTAANARGGSARAAAGMGVTINVLGSPDPQGTARAVQRLLAHADVRTGRRRLA